MTANDWSPPADDVEAAARKFWSIDGECPTLTWTSYQDDAIALLRSLHARGWRDAAEVESVTYLRTRLDTLMAAHSAVIADRDALAARVKDLEREVEDADAAIAIIEHTMMEDGGFDAVAWVQRNNDLTRRLATSEARLSAEVERLRSALRLALSYVQPIDHEGPSEDEIRESYPEYAAKVDADRAEIRAALTPTADTDGSKT